jgi:hypothetical protein
MERSEGDMSLKNPVTPPGIDPGTVRLVAQRLNHYLTPGPLNIRNMSKFCGPVIHILLYPPLLLLVLFPWFIPLFPIPDLPTLIFYSPRRWLPYDKCNWIFRMVLDLTLVFASHRVTEPAKILQPHLPELKNAETVNAIFVPKVQLTNRVIYMIFNVYAARVWTHISVYISATWPSYGILL